MPLTQIIWNDLYSSHLNKRAFAEVRIEAHYSRFPDILGAANCASVRYVTYAFFSPIPCLEYLQAYGLAWQERQRAGRWSPNRQVSPS